MYVSFQEKPKKLLKESSEVQTRKGRFAESRCWGRGGGGLIRCPHRETCAVGGGEREAVNQHIEGSPGCQRV